MRLLRGILAVSIAIVGLTFAASHAGAACHSFTLKSNSPVNEGAKVTVTVQRDAAVNESSVQIETVDGTAKAPSDYTAMKQTVAFTNETSRTVQVQTTENATHEPSETFKVRFVPNSGSGCAVNPNFQYGQPTTITITDDDAVPAPTLAPTHAATQPPAVSHATQPPATSSSVSPTPSASPSPSPTGTLLDTTPLATVPLLTSSPLAVAEEGSGKSGLLLGLAIAGLALAGAGALIFARLRMRP